MASFDDNGFPVVHLSHDGWSTDDEATATCFCGSVQLVLVSYSYSSHHSRNLQTSDRTRE